MIDSRVAMLGGYILIPYAFPLVITGLIIGPIHILPQIHLCPEIMLTIFLPPLLFESALNLRLKLLRENWKPVFFLFWQSSFNPQHQPAVSHLEGNRHRHHCDSCFPFSCDFSVFHNIVNWLKSKMPFKWQHILIWGGVRGALPMALVVVLGFGFPQHSELVVIAFGVVLFSLLIQGLNIKTII